MNAAFTYESFQHIVLVGIEQAQQVHAIFGDRFEAAECEQPGVARRLYQALRFLNAIMIRHTNDLDAVFLASCDDRRVVLRLRLERSLLAVPPQVRKGVDLQRAAIEARAVRQPQSSIQTL